MSRSSSSVIAWSSLLLIVTVKVTSTAGSAVAAWTISVGFAVLVSVAGLGVGGITG